MCVCICCRTYIYYVSTYATGQRSLLVRKALGNFGLELDELFTRVASDEDEDVAFGSGSRATGGHPTSTSFRRCRALYTLYYSMYDEGHGKPTEPRGTEGCVRGT